MKCSQKCHFKLSFLFDEITGYFGFSSFTKFTPTMSDNVNEIMEQMVPSLRDMETNEIFSHVRFVVVFADA